MSSSIAVNARELHTFLGVGRDFNTWIKARIEKYGFSEGVDYITDICSPNLGSKGRGGHNIVEYHISIDMAKELSMVESDSIGGCYEMRTL